MSESLYIIKELSDFAANSVAPAFEELGKGIGAIMLLIVVVYYVTSILDGGKFQIKMLIPLFIFILVCNFSWVTTPITYFTTTLSEKLCEVTANTKEGILSENNCSPSASINDMYHSRVADDVDPEDEIVVERLLGKTSEEDDNAQKEGLDGRGSGGFLQKKITKGIDVELNHLSHSFQTETSGEKYAPVGEEGSGRKFTTRNFSISGLISSIVSWVCKVMTYVLRAFGGVMSGIIVAFGPITFAFAVMPGEGNRIKNWVIRLCQYSLWAPVCALIDCFSVKIFDMMADATGPSFLMAIAVAVCNLVALTSVPTIAALAVEGAMEGAVSLSNGLQTIGSGLMKTKAVGAAAGTMVLGKDRTQGIKDTMAGAKNMGLAGMAKDLGTKGHSLKGMMGRMQASGRASRMGRK